MNPVAAPATATVPTPSALTTESDLVRRAAQGDPESVTRLAPTPPADLEDRTVEWWRAGGVATRPHLAPLGAWLEDRAVRPMGVAVGTLVGLGLIALGVVPGGTAVRTQLGANGPSSLTGSVPVGTGPGTGAGALNPLPGGSTYLSVVFPGAPFGPSDAVTAAVLTAGGAGGSAASTLPPGKATGGGGSAGGSTGGTAPSGGTAGGTAPSGGTPATGAGSGSGSAGGSGAPGSGGAGGGASLTVPGVGTVSTNPTGRLGTPTINVTTTGGTTVTINCDGTIIQAAKCPAPATTTTTTPVNNLISGVTGPVTTLPVVGGRLGDTTQTVTTTVTAIIGGL